MDRKPGETVNELAARIRQDAVTCDFPSIKDPLDEAMRTRFLCSIKNEAVLKAMFKVKDDELTFARAIEIAIETEEAAKVAKETVHGKCTLSVSKVTPHKQPKPDSKACFRCDKKGHEPKDCYYRESTCTYCKIKGHLETACRKKKKATVQTGNKPGPPKSGGGRNGVKRIHAVTRDRRDEVPELQLPLKLNGNHTVNFEVDTGAGDNFLGRAAWASMGQPELTESDRVYESASHHSLPVLGSLQLDAQVASSASPSQQRAVLDLQVADISDLNLLGRKGIAALGVSVDGLLTKKTHSISPLPQEVHTIFRDLKPNLELQSACRKLCEEFPDLFKPELGTLRDIELEVKFKPGTQSVFRKPRSVPLALQDDLAQAYEAGIKRGYGGVSSLMTTGLQ